MKIKFLGAALSVTGSCHLVTTKNHQFLLDCGLFQGSEAEEELNYQPFDFEPSNIDFLILSHAHVDHCGRIPLLVKKGFKGKIYCTGATAEITEIMLKDSGNIHEMDALWKNKRNKRSGKAQIKPLYTQVDATACSRYFFPINYGDQFEIDDEISLKFSEAGHILGAAITELWIREKGQIKKLVYSGDIGGPNQRMLKELEYIKEADYLIMETTYGDRTHETREESTKRLLEIILKTVERGGTIVVPSFALGRTQDLIRELELLYEHQEKYKKELSKLMVYVDSPLGIHAIEIFKRNTSYFNKETQSMIEKGDELFDFKNLKYTRSIEQSKALNANTSPKIIIASSGMADAGRVQHHLKHNLWRPKSSIVFVGYQVDGSTGRAIISGEEYVRILRERVRVAAEIYSLEGFSAHADKNDLLKWLSAFTKEPKKIFLVHGEEESKKAFAQTVKNSLGYACTVVADVSEYNLDDEGEVYLDRVKSRVYTKRKLIEEKNKLGDIHDQLDTLLTQSDFMTNQRISDKKRKEMVGFIEDLEKTSTKLLKLVEEENKKS